MVAVGKQALLSLRRYARCSPQKKNLCNSLRSLRTVETIALGVELVHRLLNKMYECGTVTGCGGDKELFLLSAGLWTQQVLI